MKYRGVKHFFLYFFISFLGIIAAFGQNEIPKPQGLVNDFAGVLDAAGRQNIESKLRRYEDSTSTQIAVVIEKDLPGGDAYNRAMQFARGWGVGSKEKNNGIVLYISVKERKYFTLTSQAVQGKLPDGRVGEIERNYLVPNLRKGDYTAAIDQTVTAYMQSLDGEFVAGKKKDKGKAPGWVFFLVVFGIITLISIINNRRPGRGYRSGGIYWFPTGGWGGNSGGWGGGSGGGGWGGFGGGGGFDGGGAGGSW